MDVVPAIDLIGDRVVRLTKGDYAAETAYDLEPGAAAVLFADAGATRVHIVDLDGARKGVPSHLHVARRIAEVTGLAVEFGGGLRSRETIDAAFAAKVSRVILGTAAFRDPGLLAWAVQTHGDRVMVSLDAKGADVMVEGWVKAERHGLVEAFDQLAGRGVRRVVFTDTTRDGTLAGVDVAGIAQIAGRQAGLSLQFAGGVKDLADVRRLKAFEAAGLEAIIAGKSLYEGTLDLKEALSLARAA